MTQPVGSKVAPKSVCYFLIAGFGNFPGFRKVVGRDQEPTRLLRRKTSFLQVTLNPRPALNSKTSRQVTKCELKVRRLVAYQQTEYFSVIYDQFGLYESRSKKPRQFCADGEAMHFGPSHGFGSLGCCFRAKLHQFQFVVIIASLTIWKIWPVFVKEPLELRGRSRWLKQFSNFLYLIHLVLRQRPLRLPKLAVAGNLRTKRFPDLVTLLIVEALIGTQRLERVKHAGS